MTAYPVADEAFDPRFRSVDCVFFVIGAQKAGTTWLSRYFLKHPAVAVPYWKENNYWNMVQGASGPGRMLEAQRKRRETDGFLRKAAAQLPFTRHAKHQRAITLALKAADTAGAPHSAYADLILENVNEQTKAAGELCPQYALLTSDTYREMSQLSDNTRFIYMMRDPVSRSISGARHALRKGGDSDPATPEALSNILKTSAKRAGAGKMTHSNYDQTIERLEAAVRPENILYVFFERLFDQAELKRICDFVGAPFVAGDIARKRNHAGEDAIPASTEDRVALARALAPTYAYLRQRFGADLPGKWQESAALC